VKVPGGAPRSAGPLEGPEALASTPHVPANGGTLRALILDEGEHFGPIIESLVQHGIKVVGVARSAEQTFTALSHGLPDIVVRCVWARDGVPAAGDGKPPIHGAGDHNGHGADPNPQDQRIVNAIANLTPRERQILALLIQGASNKEMAKQLAIRSNTVRTHVQNVLAKLRVHTRLGAATLAMRHGSFAPTEWSEA